MAKFWRFDELVQNVDSTQANKPPRPPSYPPQKSSSRILLVETNNSSSSSSSSNYTTVSPPPSSVSSSSQQRIERLTLQEVATNTSPTYYGAASLSYHNSLASTSSSQSNMSTKSHPMSFSPPPSPSVMDSGVLCTSPTSVSPPKSHRPSWTSSMDDTTSAAPYPPFMVGSTLPLGWLRPSLSSTALLDINLTGHPSHFVCLGFGQTDILMDLFGLQGPVPLDGDGISERSFFFKVDDGQQQQVMCTLASLPSDGEEYSYLENLTLNRIGVTSILVALPVLSTVDKIMRVLGQINKTLTGLDPQGTWWQRLILVFHHETADSNNDDNNITSGNTTQNETLDQRFQLVRDTLPSLMPHLSVLPCVILMASSTLACVDYQQQCRRLLYQQLCMHQTDHGWWHGSTLVMEDASASSDDDELGALLPVAVMIGKKTKKKKRPLFTIDKIPTDPPAPPASQPMIDDDDGDHTKQPTRQQQQQQHEPPLLCDPPALKHRFSKKWKEAPKRHHTITKSPLSPPPFS